MSYPTSQNGKVTPPMKAEQTPTGSSASGSEPSKAVPSLGNIERLEADLWEAADNLRANSKLTSSEYCMPVLGVIFLRHAANRFEAASKQIEADQASGKMPKRKVRPEDYITRRALFLPELARYDNILATPKEADLATALVTAMNAIEESFEPLHGVLPKDFSIFERTVLEDLMKVFNREALKSATGDVFGRIYEYFLMKFAMQGAQDNGEFFTPPSLVQMIVNVIEPDRGVVADLACGSGGMFVQSSHFIEAHGHDTMRLLTFYGQEKTATTIKLAKMNLAVHGLEGHIAEANTFYQDEHRLEDGRPLWGNVDFGMANPPFNVDMVDAEKIKDDRRLPFGLPGVNKGKKVSNGNYLWISYFHSYLSPKGRAGFVMSSQASSAGHGERDVRRKIVQTGDVDVMISIRSNFFYTRSVPCELWFFDKSKPEPRRDKVLMLDARNVFRKVTRKIYDFSPEQMKNLSAIVWLYRGEDERFAALLEDYRDTCRAKRREIQAAVPEAVRAFNDLGSAIKVLASTPLSGDFQRSLIQFDQEAKALEAQILFRNYTDDPAAVPDLAHTCKAWLHRFRDAAKAGTANLATALQAAGDAGARRDLKRHGQEMEVAFASAVEALEANNYFTRHLAWLLHRFPEGTYCDVPGLVKLVGLKEIEAADWGLTPGRYVGVAPAEADDEENFEEEMRGIHAEIGDLNAEATELAQKIQTNLEDLLE
jgi:type I restriction enzyme M protein